MAVDLVEYDELIHHVYDAALEPHRWPDVVAHVAHACSTSRSLMYTPLHVPAQGGLVFSHNITQAAIEQWSAFSVSDDPFASAALARGLLSRQGVTFIGRDLVDDAALKRSRLYREIWASLDIAQVCSGVVFDGGDSHTVPTVVSVYRAANDAVFDAGDLALMRRLMAHMSRSLGVMFHLRDSQLQVASNLVALDRLAAGVVLIDGRGAVQFANAAAERLFRRADPITVTAPSGVGARRLGLAPRLSRLEDSFQRALSRSLESLVGDSPVGHFSEAIVLPDATAKPSCVLHMAPLGNAPTFTAGGARPQAIMFLYDLTAAAAVPSATLCELFGLTPAEARAALQILQGGGVEDMGLRLGVSANTVKSQLKAVYAKTRTNRQADLLKLILALAVA